MKHTPLVIFFILQAIYKVLLSLNRGKSGSLYRYDRALYHTIQLVNLTTTIKYPYDNKI